MLFSDGIYVGGNETVASNFMNFQRIKGVIKTSNTFIRILIVPN